MSFIQQLFKRSESNNKVYECIDCKILTTNNKKCKKCKKKLCQKCNIRELCLKCYSQRKLTFKIPYKNRLLKRSISLDSGLITTQIFTDKEIEEFVLNEFGC